MGYYEWKLLKYVNHIDPGLTCGPVLSPLY